MNFTAVNGLNTSYYSAGKGQHDMLLLHGWASSGRMWLRSMWALRHEYRVWALDLPGFGDSEAPATPWTSITQYTDHVAAFCESMGIRPYAVIGHSMGARIALDLARLCPHLAERIVAVSPTITGRLGLNLDIFLLGPVGRALKRISHRIWPVAAAGSMTYYWAPRYLGSEAVQRTTDDLRRSNSGAAIESLRALVHEDYTSYLSDISQPTLLICGKRDITIPPEDSRLAANYLPDSRLLMLDQIHHQPTDECPDIYLDAVRDFLDGKPVGEVISTHVDTRATPSEAFS